MAAVKALQFAIDNNINTKITIKSDSEYLVRGITKDIKYWMKNGWKLKSTNAPVKNQSIWEHVYELSAKLEVEWIHTRRESEDGQKIADQLARQALEDEKDEHSKSLQQNENGAELVADINQNFSEVENRNLDTELASELNNCNQSLNSEETIPKCVVNELEFDNECILCDDKCNELMIDCQFCKGRVHYVCSMLPGYYLNIIMKGEIKYTCINCSNDKGEFRHINLIDKMCDKHEILKTDLNRAIQKRDELSAECNKVTSDN